MSSANVVIHSSQFPERVREDLLRSLRTRKVNHKFHYDSVKQTQKWLALHEAHSPARNDKDCLAIYARAFKAASARIKAQSVHVVGLGCGGGQKDARLLKLLRSPGRKLFYTPSDVSVAMTLVARRVALKIVTSKNCFPFVCDLATADDLARAFSPRNTQGATRLFTFFGMIPNFDPQMILPKLVACVPRNDWLLFSANLAPGKDYTDGMKKILPQYDNDLTRNWLMTFLLDLGIENKDGELRFSIENGGLGLKRVMARFHFQRSRRVQIEQEVFSFKRGDAIQSFFSYRYKPKRVSDLLDRHGFRVYREWITESEEEGVFLCRRR